MTRGEHGNRRQDTHCGTNIRFLFENHLRIFLSSERHYIVRSELAESQTHRLASHRDMKLHPPPPVLVQHQTLDIRVNFDNQIGIQRPRRDLAKGSRETFSNHSAPLLQTSWKLLADSASSIDAPHVYRANIGHTDKACEVASNDKRAILTAGVPPD